MVKVFIKRLDKGIDIPTYANKGDAAFDLRSSESALLKAGEQRNFKTGVQVAIPEGYAGLVWDRSGLASKHGLHCLAGVIDSGYRGEISIVLKNLGKDDFLVGKNMRIAQMLIQPVVSAKIEEVEELDETERGEGGFGSTGLEEFKKGKKKK
jgi:dUTP pyrophosphatase